MLTDDDAGGRQSDSHSQLGVSTSENTALANFYPLDDRSNLVVSRSTAAESRRQKGLPARISQARSWLQSTLSTAFVLVVDLSLAFAIWCVLVITPNLVLMPLIKSLRTIPAASIILDASIAAAASLVASVLCVRIVFRLISYSIGEGGLLQVRNPVRLVLLVALLVAGCVAFVLDETGTGDGAKTASAWASGAAYCFGLWRGVRSRASGRLANSDLQNVVFLRRFLSFADRSVVDVVRRSVLPESRLVILHSPKDLLRLWDPIQILFTGLNLRRPWRKIPIYIRADNHDWLEQARKLLRSAQVIVIDVSELSESLRLELAIVREVRKYSDLVLISEQRALMAASRELDVPAAALIPYRRSVWRSCFRFILGFFAVTNGCFFLNLGLLALMAEVLGPDGIAWVRSLWKVLGSDLLATLFVLGLPLCLWASWKLLWTARLDRASSRSIVHAIRQRLNG